MPDEFYGAERDRFHLKNPNCYILQGRWPKEASAEAFLDQQEVKVQVKRQCVVSALERFDNLDLARGEMVEISVELPKSLEHLKKLTVYADTPDRRIRWYAASVKELAKRKGKPQFYIEEERVEDGSLRVRGWAVGSTPVRIRLYDENKKRVPVEILRTERVDIRQYYGEMDHPDKNGFYIELPQVTGKVMYLVFYAGGEKTVHVIHLGAAAILKKKAGKFARKGVRYWREHGSAALTAKVLSKIRHANDRELPYQKWLERHLPGEKELERERETVFEYQPKISIVVPLDKTPEPYLKRLVESVQEQTYSNWELCLSDGSGEDSPLGELLARISAEDSRIRVVSHNTPLAIPENTNAGIGISTGDYLGFMDPGDELTPNALFACVKALNADPKCKLLYSDEDKMTMDGHKFFQPHCKPDYNPDLLCTTNYISHLFVAERGIVEQVGGFRSEFNGSQDYDFIFRCVEAVRPEEICHIPKILYHGRCREDSAADHPEGRRDVSESGKRAVEEHYKRMGIRAEVSMGEFPGLYRTKFLRSYDPLVSMIIPNKDHAADLKKCLDSIEEKSSYRNFEYIIVENNSTQEETFRYYQELETSNPKVHVVTWKGEFNYSSINNFGASFAKGEYLLLLNNDTEVINEDWLEELLGYCMRSDVGAVGARLYYEDDTIQHAGVIIGLGGVAGHCFVQQPRGVTGYCHRIISPQDYSAVTAACMMVKKSAFDQVGGLNEELQVAFNDIDFCLKLRQAGYLIVYNPYAELYHYESKSRGLEDTPEKVARFGREISIFEKRWPEILQKGDPYYNPNLTLLSQDFSLRRI